MLKRFTTDNGGQARLRREAMAGQAMTVTMLFMSGLILSATAIAGLLLVFQVRQSRDAVASAQAVFASDAGIERSLYCYFYELDLGSEDISFCNVSGGLGNGSTYRTDVQFEREDPAVADSSIVGFRIRSRGSMGKANRILEAFFDVR